MRPTTDSEIILQQDHILVFVVVVVDMDALEDKFSTIKKPKKAQIRCILYINRIDSIFYCKIYVHDFLIIDNCFDMLIYSVCCLLVCL